jgi:hypothetical protein
MFTVSYENDPEIYVLSEMMKSCSLFQTLIETGDTNFCLKLERNIFLQLNNNGRLSLENLSLTEIDSLYEGLYYFGCNFGLDQVDEYVYQKELKEARTEVEGFILEYPNVVSDIHCIDLSESFFQSFYFDCDHPQKHFLYINPYLKDSFFRKNIAKCDKTLLLNRVYMTEDFVEEFELFGGMYLTDCKNLSEEFLEKHIDKIEYIDSLSEQFTRRHLDKVNWTRIVFNRKISEAFFEEYYHMVNIQISYLCMNNQMSEGFFERHILDIRKPAEMYLSMNNSISEAFFRKHPTLINWDTIFYNKNISEKFIRENLDRVNWRCISNSSTMSEEFFEEFLHKLYWPDISYNKHISEAFFQKHIRRLNWECICYNPSITEEFIEMNIEYINSYDYKYLITMNQKVSEEFIIRNEEKMKLFQEPNMGFFSWFNPNISISFYRKHINNIDKLCGISIYKIVDRCSKYRYNSWKKLNVQYL